MIGNNLDFVDISFLISFVLKMINSIVDFIYFDGVIFEDCVIYMLVIGVKVMKDESIYIYLGFFCIF